MADSATQGWLNRRTLTWAGYDVASSVYFGVAPAVLLPLYFRSLMADFANPTAAWGALAAGAILASGVAALIAAALTAHISRLTLLSAATAGMVLSIAVLAWPPLPSLAMAAAAFVAAQSFYFAATSVYESFLPDLLPQRFLQKLSGFGWAIGYLGGAFAIVILLQLVGGQTQTQALMQDCFTVLAIISAAFFVIVLMLMKRADFGSLGPGPGAPQLSGVIAVIGQWRRHRGLYVLLAGTMLVHLAVSVVVTFTAPILATRFGQTLPDLLWLLLLLHVLSVPSTIGWNMLMTSWSRVVPMTILLSAWGFVLLLMAFGSGPLMPVVTVTVIGCCVGATASALRGFLAESVPPGSAPAFFALATVAGRVAAALGPALFAVITMLKGQEAALMVVVLLLCAGAALVLVHLVRSEVPLQPARLKADG
ncbi:MAG: MFS transporter [Aestuariivirga sp.]|uniref:MFS transporter n=1 Tax=Aestuariivirga sp. TaxID=2650926 RepID=UPI0030180025